MRLSMRTQYALRALTVLAMNSRGGPVTSRELASQQDIPLKFLERVLVNLKHAGLVLSRRGRDGGYVLSRPPCDINLGELIRLMEGPESVMTSLADGPATAGLQEVMEEIDEATGYLLEGFSLEKICQRTQPSSTAP